MEIQALVNAGVYQRDIAGGHPKTVCRGEINFATIVQGAHARVKVVALR